MHSRAEVALGAGPVTGQKESGKAPTALCCENKEEVGGGEKGLGVRTRIVSEGIMA